MMNFKIGGLRTIQGEIQLLLTYANRNAEHVATIPYGYKNPSLREDPDYLRAVEEAREWVTKTTGIAERGLSYLKCPHIEHAIRSLNGWAKNETPEWGYLRAKVIALRDAIDTELKQYFYYQYPTDKARVVNSVEEDWKAALAAFPSIKIEAFRASDCYGLGHNVASVFHSMRVLEKGLCAIAADVGLTFDLQQGHNIIEQIESAIATERKTLPKGAARNERLQFLSEAAKEFFYFKDGWRNHVSHNRAEYDEHQALGTLHHVCAFMNHLSKHLAEPPP